MRMLGDARRFRDQGDEFVAPIHRFDRGDAQFFERGFVEDGTDQVFEGGFRLPAFGNREG